MSYPTCAILYASLELPKTRLVEAHAPTSWRNHSKTRESLISADDKSIDNNNDVSREKPQKCESRRTRPPHGGMIKRPESHSSATMTTTTTTSRGRNHENVERGLTMPKRQSDRYRRWRQERATTSIEIPFKCVPWYVLYTGVCQAGRVTNIPVARKTLPRFILLD